MNSYIIITGIIDDDLSKYDKLKSLSNNEIKNDNKLYKLYKEFQNNYENIINIAYINNNFFNKFEINFLDNINYTSTLNYNNEKFYLKLGYLQDYDEVEIYDGSEYKTTLDLKDNEIIIDLNFLNILTKGELLKEWNNIKENTSLKDYIAKFSNENNIIGTKAKIEVEKIPKLNNKEVIIKGIRIANLDLDKYFTSSEIYIKKELINKYINKIEITELIIDAKNKYELTNLFKNNLKDTNYIIKTKYDNKIDSVYSKKVNIKNKLEIFSKTILIIGIILLIISIYIENKKHKKI